MKYSLEQIKAEIESKQLYRPKSKIENLNKGVGIFEEIAKLLEPNFKSKQVKEIIEFILQWSFCSGNVIDFKKGFLIKGNTGRGKTFLFKAWIYFLKQYEIRFQHNGVNYLLSPQIHHAKKIAGEYQSPSGGYSIIEKYSKLNCLCIDDIGTEPENSGNYGNKINVIVEIINNREEAGLLTFGTSNVADLTKIYDDRTISRMSKLFNIKTLNHNIDFRK